MQSQEEAGVKKWIEQVLSITLGDGTLLELLKDGVILCHLINKITGQPSKFPSQSKMSFIQMENICFFIENARKLGVPDSENFQTIDLFEGSGMKQVVCCICSLSRHLHRNGHNELPVLGPKLIEPTVITFTQEQLDEAKRTVRRANGYIPECMGNNQFNK